MIEAQLDRVQNGAVAQDRTACLQAFQARLGGRFRQPDPARQFGHRQPALGRQRLENRQIEPVEIK